MEYEEFAEQISESNPEDLLFSGSSAFLLFCFEELFKNENGDSNIFLAAAAAHTFSQKNWIAGTRIANKSARLRFKKSPNQSNSLKMRA